MKDKIHFGPAGNSDSFTERGYKKTVQVPTYLEEMGLNAYEYQCGHGVRISDAAAAELGEEAARRNIRLSVHAPYYISMSSVEEEKRRNSVDYIVRTARAAHYMGADRIVVHTGSCGKISREEALRLTVETMEWSLEAVAKEGFGEVRICPEVMGKINQLGTLEEVLAICGLDKSLIPCVDFGHLNARTFGGLRDAGNYRAAFEAIELALGAERARSIHIHFSRIEFTEKGGEKRHWTFADEQYGPEFPPLAEVLAERGATPTIICESSGTQAEDAATMRDMFGAASAKNRI